MVDYENEHIYKIIDQIKDESCESFFINGKCPISRYKSKNCPLHPEYRGCIVEKE